MIAGTGQAGSGAQAGGQRRKIDFVAAPQGDRNPFSIVDLGPLSAR
jgi:hypothetical protein